MTFTLPNPQDYREKLTLYWESIIGAPNDSLEYFREVTVYPLARECKSVGLEWGSTDLLARECKSVEPKRRSSDSLWDTKERIPIDNWLKITCQRILNDKKRVAERLASLRRLAKDLASLRVPWLPDDSIIDLQERMQEPKSISWGLADLPNDSLNNIRERINQAKMYKNHGFSWTVRLREGALDLSWQDDDVLEHLLEAIRLGKECRLFGLPWSYDDSVEDLQERTKQHPRQDNIALLHLKFETEHLRLSCYSQSPGASKPCRRFAGRLRSSKDIWGKGIITLKRLLNGGSPSTLVHALSAISIACAVAFVLDATGETFGMRDEVIADIDRWKIAIVDPSEQIAFTEIAAALWPRKTGTVGQSAYGNLDEGHQPPWDSFERLAKKLIDCSRGFFSLDSQNTNLVSSRKSTLPMERPYGEILETNWHSAGSIPPSYDPPETLEIYARGTSRSSTPYNAVEDFDVPPRTVDWSQHSYVVAGDSDVCRRKTGGGQSPYKLPTACKLYRWKTGGGQPPYDPTKYKGRQSGEILGVIPAATTTGGNLPSSMHDTNGLALPPEVPLDQSIDLQLPVFIMAGAIFIAILIFMNLMRISNFFCSRDGQRVQIESEWRAAAQRRLESSVKIAEEGAIGSLRAEPAFSCFTGVFRDAGIGLKDKTLTGFSAVVDFIQVEAEIQFPEEQDLRSELCDKAGVMLGQSIYQAGKGNIGPHIAEFKFLLSWYTGDEDLDEIFSWREQSEAPLEADLNHQWANPLNLSEQYQCTVVLPNEDTDLPIDTGEPEWMDTAQSSVGSDLPVVEELVQPQDQEDSIPIGARSYPESQNVPCSRKRRASLVDTSGGGPSEPPTKTMKQTTIQPIICEECGKTFSRVGNLNRHNREHHTSNGIELYSCLYSGCNETFTRMHAREKHHQNRRIHPTPLPF